MAHEIEMVAGKASMFFAGEVPWHGLGTKLEGKITSEQAIVAAGLDWKVGTKPLYAPKMVDENGQVIVSQPAGDSWERVSHRATYRESDGKILGVVGPNWTPLQNREVCANTLAMAHGDEATNLVKIHHHGNVADALGKLGEIMNVVNKRFEATADQYRKLALTSCDEDTLKKYANLVFAPRRIKQATIDLQAVYGDVIGDAAARAQSELKSRVYPKIAELFETGRGNAAEGVRGTLWAGYNAITEYLVHERGKDASARLESAWFGQGHSQNALALKVGVQLATKPAELENA